MRPGGRHTTIRVSSYGGPLGETLGIYLRRSFVVVALPWRRRPSLIRRRRSELTGVSSWDAFSSSNRRSQTRIVLLALLGAW